LLGFGGFINNSDFQPEFINATIIFIFAQYWLLLLFNKDYFGKHRKVNPMLARLK